MLYEDSHLLFMGGPKQPGILGDTIRTVKVWREYAEGGGILPEHFCINPLDGIPSPKSNGDGTTLRGNKNVAIFLYALGEFDGRSREDQLRFWSTVKIPIRCLIDSGNKSIHALIDVQKLVKIDTLDQWNEQIKNRLFGQFLKPMGIDTATSNPARLSRTPGHFRSETGKYQRILWLSPEGRYISR